MILQNAESKIARFNQLGLHYNLVANAIYKERETANPLSDSYLQYVIAGLISFDMERMMGSGQETKYDINAGGFATRLHRKLQQVRPLLEPLINLNLVEIDIQEHSDSIKKIYNALSCKGDGALHDNSTKEFHVGATKILHFLNPNLFIIVDSNASRAYRRSHNVPFLNTTQPGYSAKLYVRCMECVKKDILDYGLERFQALEEGILITRIYDKLTFVTGSEA